MLLLFNNPIGQITLTPIEIRTIFNLTTLNVRISKLIACVNPAETWQSHFTSRAWNSPQDQINAGYPIYCQPAVLTGSYEETVDFGGVFTNVIINLNWSFVIISNSVTVTPKIATSVDGITFTSFVTGASLYAQNVRYVRVHFDFVGANDKSLAEFSNLEILLDVKNEIDGGEGDALAADASGTIVTFNKPFKSVNSITVSARGTNEVKAIYDFVSVPNPTSFKVLLFNAAGVRVDGHFSWKARGVI